VGVMTRIERALAKAIAHLEIGDRGEYAALDAPKLGDADVIVCMYCGSAAICARSSTSLI
jgi:hypothetical protein